MAIKAFGAFAGDRPLEPIDIERRAPGPNFDRMQRSDVRYRFVIDSATFEN